MPKKLYIKKKNTAKELGTPSKVPEGQDHPSPLTPGKPGSKKTGKKTQSVHRLQAAAAARIGSKSQSGPSKSGESKGEPVTGVAAKQSVIAAGKHTRTGETMGARAAGSVSAPRGGKPSHQDRRRAAFILGHMDPNYRSSAEGIEQRLWAASILSDLQPAKAGRAQPRP